MVWHLAEANNSRALKEVRRLHLVLAALTHLTKAEIASLREELHLPGGTILHDLVYGYAVDS